jgi:hypothetical protein
MSPFDQNPRSSAYKFCMSRSSPVRVPDTKHVCCLASHPDRGDRASQIYRSMPRHVAALCVARWQQQ